MMWMSSGFAGSHVSLECPVWGNGAFTQHRLKKIFLFNAGLDVGYMTAGAFIAWGPFDERTNQWGTALIIQGGFLSAFDVATAVLHSRHRERRPNDGIS